MPRAFPQRLPASLASLALPALLAFACAAAAADAGAIRVRVLDEDGAPVADVAVSARPLAPLERPAKPQVPATMNQHDLEFEPHILVVETGTEVRFPNTDDVRHHVYSFSDAKNINMTIASGSVEGPLVFDKAGIVTLGCNIHDTMLAYIVVVDTPYFAKTDADGTAGLNALPAGRYELSIWTPRVPAKRLPDPVVVEIAAGQTLVHDETLRGRLYPPHSSSESDSLEWHDY